MAPSASSAGSTSSKGKRSDDDGRRKKKKKTSGKTKEEEGGIRLKLKTLLQEKAVEREKKALKKKKEKRADKEEGRKLKKLSEAAEDAAPKAAVGDVLLDRQAELITLKREGKIDAEEYAAQMARLVKELMNNDAPIYDNKNPLKSHTVVDIGTSSQTEVVKMKFRVDPNLIICTEEAPITQKDSSGKTTILRTYPAWSLKRVPRGESDEGLVVRKDGTKGKPFNFTGKLSTLPELHLALRELERTSRLPDWPTVEETLNDESQVDEFGIKDLNRGAARSYPATCYRFSDIMCLVTESSYRNGNGEKGTYISFQLRKKKPESIRKRCKKGDSEYFIMSSAIRNLPCLLRAVTCLMAGNKLPVLPLPKKSKVTMLAKGGKPKEDVVLPSDTDDDDDSDADTVVENGLPPPPSDLDSSDTDTDDDDNLQEDPEDDEEDEDGDEEEEEEEEEEAEGEEEEEEEGGGGNRKRPAKSQSRPEEGGKKRKKKH